MDSFLYSTKTVISYFLLFLLISFLFLIMFFSYLKDLKPSAGVFIDIDGVVLNGGKPFEWTKEAIKVCILLSSFISIYKIENFFICRYL